MKLRASNKKSPVFRRLYATNIVILFAAILWYAYRGFVKGEGEIGEISAMLVGMYLGYLMLGTPLCFTLLVLSVWGAVRNPQKRLVFLGVSAILVVLIAWGIYGWFTLVLP